MQSQCASLIINLRNVGNREAVANAFVTRQETAMISEVLLLNSTDGFMAQRLVGLMID